MRGRFCFRIRSICLSDKIFKSFHDLGELQFTRALVGLLKLSKESSEPLCQSSYSGAAHIHFLQSLRCLLPYLFLFSLLFLFLSRCSRTPHAPALSLLLRGIDLRLLSVACCVFLTVELLNELVPITHNTFVGYGETLISE